MPDPVVRLVLAADRDAVGLFESVTVTDASLVGNISSMSLMRRGGLYR